MNTIGWKCPGCGRCHAPSVNTCPHCAPYTFPNHPIVPNYTQPYWGWSHNPIVYKGGT